MKQCKHNVKFAFDGSKKITYCSKCKKVIKVEKNEIKYDYTYCCLSDTLN